MLLLYCMTEANITVMPPATGVRGGAVTSMVEEASSGGIRCFYSDSNLSNTSQHTNQIAVDAMEFDAVIRGIFKEAAIIPFRFMTALANIDELRAFLKSNGDEYVSELAHIRSKIQMEVRVTVKPRPRDPDEDTSGTDFLKTKQAAAQAVEAVADRIMAAYPKAQWKRKSSPDGCRLYALVERNAKSGAGRFTEAISRVEIDPQFNVRTSGPWPATEFINCYADLQSAIAGAKK
jgi:Gas vesicle synthesis protein GvpL/GvpF